MSKWIINQQDNCVKVNFPKLIKLAVGIIKYQIQKKSTLKNLLDTTKSQENNYIVKETLTQNKYYINEATSTFSETVRACYLCSN